MNENIINLFLLIFKPSKLIKKCVDSSYTGNTNEEIESSKYMYYKQYSESVPATRNAIIKGLLVMVMIIVLSYCSSLALLYAGVELDSKIIKILKIIGPCILIIAIYSRMGKNTIGGNSIPERLNTFWFKSLYFVGMYITLFINMI